MSHRSRVCAPMALADPLPQSGQIGWRTLRHRHRQVVVRELRTCHKCGRPVVHWRFPGADSARPRCGGPDRMQCGKIRAERAAAVQEAEARARARQLTRRREGSRQQQKQLGSQPACVDEDGPHAGWFELDRARRCPRPEKKWWHTIEAADEVIAGMRAKQVPGAKFLNSYLCSCGKAHVGNRTRPHRDW